MPRPVGLHPRHQPEPLRTIEDMFHVSFLVNIGLPFHLSSSILSSYFQVKERKAAASSDFSNQPRPGGGDVSHMNITVASPVLKLVLKTFRKFICFLFVAEKGRVMTRPLHPLTGDVTGGGLTRTGRGSAVVQMSSSTKLSLYLNV